MPVRPDFRALVTAALLTGCRYGELAAMTVDDFNPDAGTVRVRASKSGKPRHVVLTQEGRDFVARLAAGKPGSVASIPARQREALGRSPSNSARSPRHALQPGSSPPSIFMACATPMPAGSPCAVSRWR